MKIDYKIGYKIQKENLKNKEYADCAAWCNLNGAHIEDKETYYKVVKNVAYEKTSKDQIKEIESEQTPELLRNAILGDKYSIDKLKEIKSRIESLSEKPAEPK